MKTFALALATCFALSNSAFAQVDDDEPIPTPDDIGGGDIGGDEVEMGPDDAPEVPFDAEGEPSGSEENPDAPRLGKVLGEDKPPAAAPMSMRDLIARPLTLPGGTLQLSYRAGFGGLTEKIAYSYDGNDKLVRFGGVLSAEYAITDRVQLGLHYGTGTYGTIETDAGTDDSGYSVGKAVAIEAQYQLKDWVALQAEVPMYVGDPLQVAITLGAPMKFRFGDKLAFFLLEDVVTIAFKEYAPFVGDATSNEAAAHAVETNEQLPGGDITIKGGAIYKLSAKAAFKGTFGVVAQDFSMDKDPGVVLLGELFHSVSERLDLYGSAGIYNLADPGSSLHVGCGVAFRL